MDGMTESREDRLGEGEILWEPSKKFVKDSNLSAYLGWLRADRGLDFDGYQGLWQWSVDDLEGFWQSIVDYFEVRFYEPRAPVLGHRAMPGARWFEGSRLNYAEHLLRRDDDHPALVYRCEDGSQREWSYAQLRRRVGCVRAGLSRLGVEKGDRVVGFVSNVPEAVASMIATTSLGAIWSSCPPEFGVTSVLDRFRQIEPKVLIAVDGYFHNGRLFDRRDAVTEISANLPSLSKTVLLSRWTEARSGTWMDYDELTRPAQPIDFEPVAFDHPLWILYSSGTTGPPKAIVHGHGGILIEQYKQLALQSDLKEEDRFFWYTTTGWMMWNYLLGGLLLGCTVLLYDGSSSHPDLMALFRMADQDDVTYFGTSASFLMACRKAGLSPGKELHLRALRGMGSTGAPLPVEGFQWVYEHVKRDVWLASVSGGTDVCTGFVGPSPLLPVRAGHLQCRALGAAVEAFDREGRAVVDEVGELVLTEPLPSMPVSLWNDEGGKRYRDSYFAAYEGIWRHGDWIKLDPRGGAVIYGRSDSTLNRGGVRMGTSEFYRVVETLPGIIDSVVVDTGSLAREGRLWLFIVLVEGTILDDALRSRLTAAFRTQLSPRHVPDEIHVIHEVPMTLSGKKLEVPIKRILTGTPVEQAVNLGTLRNPESLTALLEVVS